MVREARTVPSGSSTDTAPGPGGPPVAASCTVQSAGWSKVYFASSEVPEKLESATAVLPPSGVEPGVEPGVGPGVEPDVGPGREVGASVGAGAESGGDVGPAGDGVEPEGFAGAEVGGAEAGLVSNVPAVGAGPGSPPHEVRATTTDSAAGRSIKRAGWCLFTGPPRIAQSAFPDSKGAGLAPGHGAGCNCGKFSVRTGS